MSILETLIKDYSQDNLSRFFNQSTRDSANYRSIGDGSLVGELEYPNGKLAIVSFAASGELSERSSKRNQFEIAKNYLKSGKHSLGGIFAFYDSLGNFRLSLIYPEYQGLRKKWNPYRRFTFYVSKELTNKTFIQRIQSINYKELDSIREAFSVEKVSNAFFDECQKIFQKTKEHFVQTNKYTVVLWLESHYSKEEVSEQINKFTYLFIGRIIFIYFLLRKGWIENRKDYIRNHLQNNKNHNLYQSFFEPLFFEVFAKREQERLSEINEQYLDTPYLNGGLFQHSQLELEMGAEGKQIVFEDKFIRDIILNFFETYNFTVDENAPNDQEVSIDPEMLGKIFENTLAEEERGKKGTFYTPREIVHYMVNESLYRYLVNELTIPPAHIHTLIYDEENKIDELTKDEIRQIDKKLELLKVLDPAVGSAAFPVEMMQILVKLRRILNVKVGNNINEIDLKKSFIKNNLYGVDIDPGAIEIAKLRLWLSLIVDYDKKEMSETPLPNLDFQFRVGNSLQEKIDDVDVFESIHELQTGLFAGDDRFQTLKNRMITVKDNFYDADSEIKKHLLKTQFDELEHQLLHEILTKYKSEHQEHILNVTSSVVKKTEIEKLRKKITSLEQKIKDGTYKLFKPDFHFSEVYDRADQNGKKIGGFDIVIGNPPYGVKVDDDIKDWHELGSKDSYGIFISTALKRFLKPGGVLSYIVSDTWLTIKTHRALRAQVLDSQLHKIIRLHQDCFDATVNPCILLLTKNPKTNGTLVVADLTNISTRNEIQEMQNKLYHLEDFIDKSTVKYAVYKYNQDLIKTNSNIPIFVGSPKLFLLMNDTTSKLTTKKVVNEEIETRQIEMNGNALQLVRFGDIAEIRQGLATGDNHSYLYQNPDARGNYRNILNYKKSLLTEKDLEMLSTNPELRLRLINNGIHKSINDKDFDESLFFGGRYIIPYDKGGESDTENGWLPNYYVPTNYYIDWSREAVRRLNTLTIKQRNNDGTGSNALCAVIRSPEYYFLRGITSSRVGEYSPTFRKSADSVFDSGCTNIFCTLDRDYTLALCCSKLFKWFFKSIFNHTVNSQVEDMKDIPINITNNIDSTLAKLVGKIVSAQRNNERYDYMSHEQREIDMIVYQMYGLNSEDIGEVETWYARRYPRLAKYCDIE